ncbi:cell division protein ZapA [Ramlibacter sp. H39-3-26]|uniref:cell division protein ZapA n=1 Tax=Curvibacter soli TaxID=3031331 RepID=UPI0023D9F0D7|nr:cell division protein ZapA [Ramlibacter sp. H39-3-26]MDF1485333.1 cell division protein ZapA [Ramlibacter sp. H39-3-26]
MKQIEVQIMQQSYRLGCPEGREERLLEAVRRVDGAMTQIRDAGKVRARDRIAVLAALNLAFELADREAAPARPRPITAADLPEDERLLHLLRRLDDALGSDGRLL